MHEIDRRGEALGGSKNSILGRTRRRLLIYFFPLFWFLDLSIKQPATSPCRTGSSTNGQNQVNVKFANAKKKFWKKNLNKMNFFISDKHSRNAKRKKSYLIFKFTLRTMYLPVFHEINWSHWLITITKEHCHRPKNKI